MVEQAGNGRAVHFVGHSLGNILVRWTLTRDTVPFSVGRVVMLAPPNQGAAAADRFAGVAGWLLRPLSGLTTDSLATVRTLPEVQGVEIGIIAARDDHTVRFTETHLPEESAHIVVDGGHTFIMRREEVHARTIEFLRTGGFSLTGPVARPSGGSLMRARAEGISPLLVYDGDCAFCSRSVQFILRHDRRRRTLRFAARDGIAGRAVRERHPELVTVDSMVWVEPGAAGRGDARPRRCGPGDRAVPRRRVGACWAGLGGLVPRVVRDAAYGVIARHRRRLAAGAEACVVFIAGGARARARLTGEGGVAQRDRLTAPEASAILADHSSAPPFPRPRCARPSCRCSCSPRHRAPGGAAPRTRGEAPRHRRGRRYQRRLRLPVPGHSRLEEKPDEAAAAFYWAARLDPSSSEALDGRRAALLMRKPLTLKNYMEGGRRARESKEFKSIDSLQLRAVRLDPLYYRKNDGTMLMSYYRTLMRREYPTAGNHRDRPRDPGVPRARVSLHARAGSRTAGATMLGGARGVRDRGQAVEEPRRDPGRARADLALQGAWLPSVEEFKTRAR